MNRDAENRDSQETRRTNERGENTLFLPEDVARAICRADSKGTPSFYNSQERSEITKSQRNALIACGLLNHLAFPENRDIDARGTEHVVLFRGSWVEKFQKSEAWMPVITGERKLGIGLAVPMEYLRRLQLHNEIFGDHIRITALTRGNRFVITQPTLKGGEPTENEIRDVLQSAGWHRVPIALQDLPEKLMGSTWWHDQENLVLLDARKPNFKKTEFGVLPIDLILADITEELKAILKKE